MSDITWSTAQIRLGDLIEWEHNPVTLSKHDAAEIKKSIDKFGLVLPLVANAPLEGGVRRLIDGHQRKSIMLMAKMAGKDTLVDVRVPSRPLEERECDELSIRLRRNTGSFDYDILANVFDMPDLLEWGFEKDELLGKGFEMGEGAAPEAKIDKAEALAEEYGTAVGQLWQLGKHRLVIGDCADKITIDVLMGTERGVLLFTDPPYNVAYSGLGQSTQCQNIENDNLSEGDFMEWLVSACKSLGTALAPGAAVYLCHGDTNRRAVPFIEVFSALGWTRSATIIWAKQAASMGWQDYRSQHECIAYGWLPGAEHYFTPDRSQTTLWEIDRDAASSYLHPTQKPVKLAVTAIENSSRMGDIVLDGFCGSGSTICACENLGRLGRGIEISPAYAAVSIKRWEDLTGDKAVLLN